jgi:sarcosine oxidase subunit delta
MRIPCPHCGLRDEPEFVFGGPSHLERPDPAVDDRAWTAYLYFRDNPAGVHLERWLHEYGCGQWFNLARNTVTHEILRAYAIGQPHPSLLP